MNNYTYEFDVHRNVVVNSCDINPTEMNQSTFPWLYARNNKYPTTVVCNEKIGKWMLFVSKDHVNAVWDQIKEAVSHGELWNTKVSTKNASNPNTHAIMIYTKDYSDLLDVIHTLDYLESTVLKTPNGRPIYYKTDQQTRNGIYSGGKEKSWIYSSATIRETVTTGTN